MSEYTKNSLLRIAEAWQLEHLKNYIDNLESQVNDIKDLLKALREIERKKQKAVNRKLRESGPRGAT
jgi:hypothetical protein